MAERNKKRIIRKVVKIWTAYGLFKRKLASLVSFLDALRAFRWPSAF
jgi:hypothetical protein